MAKRISMEQISNTMISAAAEMEAASGASKVWDPEFPLMQTPLNRKILVYIPKDVESRTVELLIHDTHKGKMFGQARCINGLSAGFEAFGYTGECPYCAATEAAWDLYNHKLDQKAAELGISRDNDPDELLKGTKETLRKEMAVKNADKYIAFPVVLLPCDNNGNLDPNSQDTVKAVYVLWRKQRYADKFDSETLDGRESPAGTFERWSFTYDTKGQQPDPMLSAKALKIKIIEKQEQLAPLLPYVEGCEKVVAAFTQLKAIDNIKALNYYAYEDVVKEADATIKSTRLMLAALQSAASTTEADALPSATPAAPQIAASAESAIANFGQVAPATPAPAPVAPQLGTVGQAPAPVAPAVPTPEAAPAAVPAPDAAPATPTFGVAPVAPQFGG